MICWWAMIVLVLIRIVIRDGEEVRMHKRQMHVHVIRPVRMCMGRMDMQSG